MESDAQSAAADQEDDLLRLLQRLDILQTQIDQLNNELEDHLDRMRRGRRRANGELGRFSHQAKKLVIYAPY